MSRTITALFNDRSEAEQAAAQLRTQIGADARIVDQSNASTGSSASGEGRGFWAELKDMFVAEDDRPTYEEGVRRGHFLLCATVPQEEADRACNLIESAGAIDVDENEQKWRGEGWTGSSSSSDFRSQSGEFSGSDTDRASDRGEVVQEERIPIVEEQLRVGKREVERGGARVRSYVEERPVSEQVNLREEHVHVERRPVDERISPSALDQNGLLQEREIQMRETAEEPVVAKEARVKEEVLVQKTADERTQEVGDTVRNTRVEVEGEDGEDDRGALFEDKSDSTPERSREFDPSSGSRD